MTGIYKITNLVNSKVYIGASKNIVKRWGAHKKCANSPIHSDLETYGLDNFKFEVLLECPETMLAQWERDMICLYDADDPEKGYNNPKDRPYSLKNSESHRGKSAWNRGLKASDEAKRKMSEAKKGRRLPEETKRKLSEANKGKSRSEETKRKLSESHKGQKSWNRGLKASDETRRRMSEARKEYWRKKKELNRMFH